MSKWEFHCSLIAPQRPFRMKVTAIGIDLAKDVFHVPEVDEDERLYCGGARSWSIRSANSVLGGNGSL